MAELSGNATLHYSVADNVPVGVRKMYCCGYSEGGNSYSAYWPNQAYFCEVCGELWGRVICYYEFDYQPRFKERWKIHSKCCAECGGGEFLRDDQLEGADKELLTRELNVLITQYEKGLI